MTHGERLALMIYYRKAKAMAANTADRAVQGTGGTDLVQFLKTVRSEGAAVALPVPE